MSTERVPRDKMYGGNDDGGASQFAGGGFMPSPGGAPGGFRAGGGMSSGLASVGPQSLPLFPRFLPFTGHSLPVPTHFALKARD